MSPRDIKPDTTGEFPHLYGPVPSRRLGLSLGVDILPPKICTLDCIYCQIGRTTDSILTRKSYVPVSQIVTEVGKRIEQGLTCDYITLTASGEPTLNSDLGTLIDGIRPLTNIPIALLTNGTLFSDPTVLTDASKADIVLPSLDAGNEKTFRKINRPCPDLDFDRLLDGLITFRTRFTGPIWLEVFLIEGINTSDSEIQDLKSCIARIRPDKIHLNTAVRPTAEPGIKPIEPAKLQSIAEHFGPTCEVIADFPIAHPHHHPAESQPADQLDRTVESILAMLKRRPCSLQDLCDGLSLSEPQIRSAINVLTTDNRIQETTKADRIFYTPTPDPGQQADKSGQIRP